MTHIRVCHQQMCVIIPKQFIDYQKVILDKGAIIIMQIKKLLSGPIEGTCNRTHLVTGKSTLFRTTKDLVFYEGLHKFSVNGHIFKQKRMKIELTNGGPSGQRLDVQ